MKARELIEQVVNGADPRRLVQEIDADLESQRAAFYAPDQLDAALKAIDKLVGESAS